jgi:cold shock CspA family protein
LDRALEQLTVAEELAPESALVKLEAARVLQYQRRFDEAALRLDAIGNIEKLSSKTRRVHLDLSLQNQLRQSEHFAVQHNFKRALECLEAAKIILEQASSSLIDPETTRHVLRRSSQFLLLARAFVGLPEEKRVKNISDWLLNPAGWFGATGQNSTRLAAALPEISALDDSELPPNRGKLMQMHPTFAFIDAGGARFFFHRKDWKGKTAYSRGQEGTIVDFDLGSNDKGVCAVNVRPISEEDVNGTGPAPARDWLSGEIMSIFPTHGFIRLDLGGSVFFHRDACADVTKFKSFAIGTRVRFRLGKNADGKRQAEDVEAYH